MTVPQEIYDRMHVPDMTLFLKDCPVCGVKPEFSKLPAIPEMESIDCPNHCRFLGGKTLIYDKIENCGQAWNNVVDSYQNSFLNTYDGDHGYAVS